MSTFFTVVVYTQAYFSTRFEASKILVWTPVILVIDAGSMLQVFFLVIEAKKFKVAGRVQIMDSDDDRSSGQGEESSRLLSYRPLRVRHTTGQHAGSTEMMPYVDGDANGNAPNDTHPEASQALQNGMVETAQDGGTPCRDCLRPGHCRKPEEKQLQWFKDPAVYCAAAAALLFVATLILQLMGLAKAAKSLETSSDPPNVRWCSTLFQPFGVAAVDGDCHVYGIQQSSHKGIGCIEIPGYWQREWLKGTVAGLTVELFTETIDLFILSYFDRKTKCCGAAVKMKRPWTTIFSGGIVLIVTLIYGINYANALPPAVTSRMTVIARADSPGAYNINITASGLRGTIIGWNDGLFEAYRGTYFGSLTL